MKIKIGAPRALLLKETCLRSLCILIILSTTFAHAVDTPATMPQSPPTEAPGPAVISLQTVSIANETRELIVGIASNATESKKLDQFFKQDLESAREVNPDLKANIIFEDAEERGEPRRPDSKTNTLVTKLSPHAKSVAATIAPRDYQKISFTQKISERYKSSIEGLKTKFREDPSIIIYTLVRGSVNGAFTAWSMTRYEHVAPLVAVGEGLLIMAQSGAIMYNLNLYLRWLNRSKNGVEKFMKGDALEMAYLFLPQLLLFLTGQQSFEGLKSIGNYALAATMGSFQQTPMDGAIGDVQKKLQGWASRGDSSKRQLILRHGVRSAALLVSVLEISVAFAQMLHLPLAREGFYLLAGGGWGVYLFQRGYHKKLYTALTRVGATLEIKSEKFLKENSCRGTFGLL